MKQITAFFAFLLLCNVGFAKHHEGDDMPIEEKKAKVTKNIDTRIASLQELKTCVAGAKEKADMKTCRKAHMERVGKLRDEMGGKKAWKGKFKEKK